MCYIPDPTEILKKQIENQIDLVDNDDTYPCCYCGRRFDYEDMFYVSAHPASPLRCGLPDCNSEKEGLI